MLTARGTKRDKSTFFDARHLMFDILDEGRQIGTAVFDKSAYSAALKLDGKDFTVTRIGDRPDEMLFQALIRMVTGGEKPPPNPWALKDAAGSVLALGDIVKSGFVVSRGGEGFSLRRVKRPYHLYREGSDQSLGWVGQQKFFTTTLGMDLPAEFEPAFQVFLLTLLLSLTMRNAETAIS
jgi:hypothetical protein